MKINIKGDEDFKIGYFKKWSEVREDLGRILNARD